MLVVDCTVSLDYVRLGRRANFFARTAERERSMRRATWRSDMVPIIASSFGVHGRNGPSRSKRRRRRSDILRLNWAGLVRPALDAAQSLAVACGFGRGLSFPGCGLLGAGFGRAGGFDDLAEEAVRAGIEAGDAKLLPVK